jgi:hypothetical protein
VALAPTTLDTLEAAFATAINAITPTHTRERSVAWRPFDGEGTDSPHPTATRLYQLAWTGERETPPGDAPFGLSAYTLDSDLTVETTYLLDNKTGDLVIAADHRDVFETLENLVPTTDGLVSIDSSSWDVEVDASGHAHKVEHKFVVRNMRARI